MIKQGKFLLIGLSSIIAVGMGSKLVSFPDEKLTTGSKTETEDTGKIVLASKQIAALPETKTVGLKAAIKKEVSTDKSPKREMVENIIKTGLARIGTPYLYGGITEKGFDCSGFVHYAFKKFNIDVPHSSSMIAETGKRVKLEETRKGDILVFTGTNVSDRTPGHVGIVISKAGEPIEFVHSSSNGGVKISQVEGTNYERRFLETRRVL